MPSALETSPDIFTAIRGGDILLRHPYESFDASAYRLGDDTPFVHSLLKAAEAGKQVACVIEIKARFDEERNLHWAAEVERVGAHVTFGVPGLKTHSKVALVVRVTCSPF
jgi:polyphosphate kinase